MLVAVDKNISAGNDVLKITPGDPVTLSRVELEGRATLAVSRTGAVAAFYPRDDRSGFDYRVSMDGGQSWQDPIVAPLQVDFCGTALRDGQVLKTVNTMVRQSRDDLFTSRMLRFSDDFAQVETKEVEIYVPNAGLTHNDTGDGYLAGPWFSKGKMVQLADGDILAPMEGRLKGDPIDTIIISKSSDQGRTWQYVSSVCTELRDLAPEVPGDFLGYSEASLALLPSGRILCVIRTQHSHLAPDYKPLVASWSDDCGKTWTTPLPTNPHLMNISPTLAVLDNGVVACAYGRPGFYVAFSLNEGRTWPERISFTDLPVGQHVGMNDLVQVGPNKLLAIGSVPGGTKVFPIMVERVKDPNPAPFTLAGQVLNSQGQAIPGATIELGPNRYTTEYQPINPEKHYPTAKTDQKGQFTFSDVRQGGRMLTIEADGYKPENHLVKAACEIDSPAFTLEPGHVVDGRLIDQDGKGLMGSCLFFDEQVHVHTDPGGNFRWALDKTPPDKAKVRIVSRGNLQQARTMSLEQIKEPIVTYNLPYPDSGPRIVCAGLTDPIPIDADIDSPPWSAIPTATDFWTQSVGPAKNIPIEAKFAYDHKRFYTTIRIKGVDGISLSDEDMIELYIDPSGAWNHRGPYQFAFNVSGKLDSAFGWHITKYSDVHTKRQSDGGWTVSISFGWGILATQNPQSGSSVGLGIAHVQSIADDHLRRAGPNRPSVVFRFGTLILAGC